jgi:hypothetical protein
MSMKINLFLKKNMDILTMVQLILILLVLLHSWSEFLSSIKLGLNGALFVFSLSGFYTASLSKDETMIFKKDRI